MSIPVSEGNLSLSDLSWIPRTVVSLQTRVEKRAGKGEMISISCGICGKLEGKLNKDQGSLKCHK